MTKHEAFALSRRTMLLGGGALVVSVGAGLSLDALLAINEAYAQGTKPPLTPDQLSSYIAVMQERTGWPLRCTVQAPHCASPQPNCGLLRPTSFFSA